LLKFIFKFGFSFIFFFGFVFFFLHLQSFGHFVCFSFDWIFWYGKIFFYATTNGGYGLSIMSYLSGISFIQKDHPCKFSFPLHWPKIFGGTLKFVSSSMAHLLKERIDFGLTLWIPPIPPHHCNFLCIGSHGEASGSQTLKVLHLFSLTKKSLVPPRPLHPVGQMQFTI